MTDILSQMGTRVTPQSRPADERQVKNSAGGYVFKAADEARLHRFLTIGVDGGTYYSRERDIALDNVKFLTELVKRDPLYAIGEAVRISEAGRAPRNNPALFTIAMASGIANDAGRKAALEAMPRVARYGTDLYTFVEYATKFRGWGRGLRRAVADWYLDRPVEQAAYQVMKYRQRNGWSHRDLLRLSHPKANGQMGALFNMAVGRSADGAGELAEAFKAAWDAESLDATAAKAEWLRLINDQAGKIAWEMLPDRALGMPEIWEAMIGYGLPTTALIRQMPRLTRLGVVSQMSPMTSLVCKQLTDAAILKKARIHPFKILVALRTYQQGHGDRGKSSWTPVTKIVDAYDAGFYAAYGAVEPSGKRTMIALDVSGSMGWGNVAGLPMQPREVTAAISLVTAATEPDYAITGFSHQLVHLDISPKRRLDDVMRYLANVPMGGTDCSLPMVWAAQQKIPVESFFVYTDNETWAGKIHPFQALKEYRQKMGINAKLGVIAVTSTGFTIADPLDTGSLDVAGFDAAVPNLLADFSRGDL